MFILNLDRILNYAVEVIVGIFELTILAAFGWALLVWSVYLLAPDIVRF